MGRYTNVRIHIHSLRNGTVSMWEPRNMDKNFCTISPYHTSSNLNPIRGIG